MNVRISLFLAIAMLQFGCAQSGNNVELSSVIDSLYSIDQKVQTDLIDAMNNAASSEKTAELFKIENETFKRHIPILEKIVTENGYPTTELVGKESSGKFFFLVQHSDADLEFQENMMKYIEKEVAVGNVSGRDFAYLTDRILLAKNEPQLYGTQLQYDEEGNAKPRNLYHPKECNARREKYGLEPLEGYLEWATEQHKLMNGRN